MSNEPGRGEIEGGEAGSGTPAVMRDRTAAGDVMLEAMGVTRRFGPVTALDGVSLRVRSGEVVGLLGPNGAGKTTALRILAGILGPDQGTVRIADLDLRSEPVMAKHRIGFLSGDTQLYQRLSPREVLVYFGRLYGLAPDRIAARVAALVAELEMEPFVDRPCGTLSSGQKQRANLARAFLHEPEVLVLDEPTTALDVVSGHFIVQAIRDQRSLGRAVLFSSHVMGEVEALCDRIYLLHEGRIVAEGTVARILERTGCAGLDEVFLRHIASGASFADEVERQDFPCA